MKSKITILLFMLFFVTGCNVTYDIQYIDDSFSETVFIKDLINQEKEAREMFNYDLSTNFYDISDYTKEEGLALGYKYYDKKIYDNNGLMLEYKYNFSKKEYENSFFLKTAFSNFYFDEEKLIVSGINDIFNRYPKLENIKIQFKTDKFISSTNASYSENGVYYWNINKDSINKSIEVKFSLEDNRDFIEKIQDKVNELEKEEKGKYLKIIKMFFIILGIVSLLVFIFVIFKFLNSNKK